jgi:hypothetical protein
LICADRPEEHGSFGSEEYEGGDSGSGGEMGGS